MTGDQLDFWQDEVDALPWGGQSPRSLASKAVHDRLLALGYHATCGVDNSLVYCRSREALRIATDPAQYQLCVSTSFGPKIGG